MIHSFTLKNSPRLTLYASAFLSVSMFLLLATGASAATTYTVDSMTDASPDATDCTDADSETSCSLRDAIAAANQATTGDYIIDIPAGTYTVDIADESDDEDNNTTGDLDIEFTGDLLTIQGAGLESTIISGNDAYRVFHVHSDTTGDVAFTDMSVNNGNTENLDESGFGQAGAGIFVYTRNSAAISLESMEFNSNVSNYTGGAVGLRDVASLSVNNVTFTDNSTNGRGGGAIMGLTIDVLDITNSVFENNAASGRGGAVYIEQTSDSSITNSFFLNNTATDGGSAIKTFGSGTSVLTLDIVHSTFVVDEADTRNESVIEAYLHASATGSSTITTTNSLYTVTSGENDPVCQAENGATITSGNYNMISDDSCSFGDDSSQNETNIFVDGDGLTNNGGDIETIGIQSTSAAVDFVPAASCLDADGVSLTEDARGMTRPENTDCDAGAYELDQTNPSISSVDPDPETLECGVDEWSMPTVTATDNFADSMVPYLEMSTVDESTVGTGYTATIAVADYDGNVDRRIQSVTVADTTAPTITLTGDEEVSVEQGGTYTESGTTVADACESGLSVTVGGDTVDTDTPGEYTVTYNVTDAEGNTGTEVTRTVTVAPDTTAPTITLVGESSVTVEFGATYTDDGATATDAVDGDLTSSIVTVNPVDTSTAGTYTVTYNVTDEAGNVAAEVTRTVIVSEEVVEDQDPDIGEGDGTEDTEATLGAVTQVTRLANNMVTITYAEGETKTFNLFDGTAKAKVKLHSNGDVLIAISKKYIRTFDAYTGEKIDQKKLFKNKQKYTKFKKYNVYNASNDDTANSVIVLARTKKNQHKKVKMRHIVVKNDGTMSKKNVVNVTLNKKIKKFKNVSLKRNKKNGKNFRVTLTKKGKKMNNYKFRITKKKKNLKQI